MKMSARRVDDSSVEDGNVQARGTGMSDKTSDQGCSRALFAVAKMDWSQFYKTTITIKIS